jgi:hypothetical protein
MNTNGKRDSGLVVGVEWEVTDVTGGAEEQSASQCALTMWFRKRGDQKFLVTTLLGKENEKSFGTHVIWKRVNEKVLLTMWLGKGLSDYVIFSQV